MKIFNKIKNYFFANKPVLLTTKVFKTKKVRFSKSGHVIYWCFGCNQYHGCDTINKNKNDANWTWNGSFDNPSLYPSVRFKNPDCHHNIINGKIEYCDDCSHNLRGQKVDMLELTN